MLLLHGGFPFPWLRVVHHGNLTPSRLYGAEQLLPAALLIRSYHSAESTSRYSYFRAVSTCDCRIAWPMEFSVPALFRVWELGRSILFGLLNLSLRR